MLYLIFNLLRSSLSRPCQLLLPTFIKPLCFRYDRCLRAGMRPDLVLDDEDKKKRFRKFSLPISENQQPALPVEPSSKGKQAENILEVGVDDDDGVVDGVEENYCEGTPLSPQVLQNMLTELTQDESFVDPETGEITQPSSQPGNR